MAYRRNNKLLLLVAIVILAITGSVQSMGKEYLYIEEIVQSHQNGNTVKAVKKSYYYSDRVLIADSSQPYDVLINTGEKLVYLINRRNQTFSVLSLSRFSELSNLQTGKIQDSHILIHKTGKKETINSKVCDEYFIMITSLNIKTSVYLSSQKKVPMHLFYSFSQRTGLGGHLTKVTSLMKKNNSYPLLSNTISATPGGNQFFLRIITRSIEARQYDAALFIVPKHFKRLEIQQ